MLCTDIKAPAKWLNKVASKNDSFTRAHEDPFVMIKQEENKVNFVYFTFDTVALF